MYDINVIKERLKVDFENTLECTQKYFDNENEKSRVIYIESLRKNKDTYDKLVKSYKDEYEFVKKQITALYDVYIVTLSQLNNSNSCNSNLIHVLNKLPALNLLSYETKFRITRVTDKHYLSKKIKFYKNPDIDIKIILLLSNNQSAEYYNILYNKLYSNGIIKCATQELDIIVFYYDNKVEFYRLSTGKLLYSERIYSTPIYDIIFIYYDNNIVKLRYSKKFCKDYTLYIQYYTITPDFTVIKQFETKYNSSPIISLLVLNMNNTLYNNITYSTTRPEIYIVLPNAIHIFTTDKINNIIEHFTFKINISTKYINKLLSTHTNIDNNMIKCANYYVLDYNIYNSHLQIYCIINSIQFNVNFKIKSSIVLKRLYQLQYQL